MRAGFRHVPGGKGMTAMERNDTSASVGLSASLVVHALLLLSVIGWYIRDVDQQ